MKPNWIHIEPTIRTKTTNPKKIKLNWMFKKLSMSAMKVTARTDLYT